MIFKTYDQNGDGELDYKEFSSAFTGGDNKQSMYSNPAGSEKMADPYVREKMRRDAASSQASKSEPLALLNLFRDKLRARGARGIVGLQRLFNMMDSDGSQTLSIPEFGKICKDFKVGISEENVPILFNLFDKNRDGTLQYSEFLETVRGEMSNARQEYLRKVWAKVAQYNQSAPMDQIKKAYNGNKHPDVVQGKRTQGVVQMEFIETFEAHHSVYDAANSGDSEVVWEEFFEYYKNISFLIDADNMFKSILKNVWDMPADDTFNKGGNAQASKTGAATRGPSGAATVGSYPVEAPPKFRPGYEPQKVMRSGIQSADNPLATTTQYYPNTTTASRAAASAKPNAIPSEISRAEIKKAQAAQNVKPASLKIENKKPVSKYQTILIERMRAALKKRGAHGILGLQRQFKIADDNGTGTLDFDEFQKAVRDFAVEIDPQDVKGLFNTMDIDGSGEIDFNEFLRMIVGEMNQFRKNLVEKAYRTLDINMDGQISLIEFQNKYNATQHPDVRSGKKTEEQVILEFMDTFQQHHNMQAGARKDDIISLEEFTEYYNNISCNIENDQYFDLMISNAWSLDGGNNPANMPYAGSKKKIANVSAKDAYRQDHHRNLFGTDD